MSADESTITGQSILAIEQVAVVDKGLSRRLEASGKAVRQGLELRPSLLSGLRSLKSLEALAHGDLDGGLCAFTSAPCELFDQPNGFRCLNLQGHHDPPMDIGKILPIRSYR